MLLTRRSLLKGTAAAAAAGAMMTIMDEPQKAEARGIEINYDRLVGARESTTICPYCACGCSTLAYTVDGELVHMEGDPDQPSTRGSLCPKGAAQFNIRNIYDPETGKQIANPARARTALYRAPYSKTYREVDLDWAMKEIAKRVREAREEGFEHKDEKGVVVNRTENIGWLGFAGADNEECQVIAKLVRGLGITYFDHQARI